MHINLDINLTYQCTVISENLISNFFSTMLEFSQVYYFWFTIFSLLLKNFMALFSM